MAPLGSHPADATSASMLDCSSESKSPSTEARNAFDRMSPPATSASTVHTAAAAIRRKASELSLIALGRRIVETIAQTAHGLDQVGVEFLAQAADEHLDRIGVAVEILLIEVLDEFGARHDLSLVMGKIGQQTVFQARQLHRVAVDSDAAGTRVDAQGPDLDLRGSKTGGAAQKRAHAGQQLFGIERLGEIVVGSGIESRDLVAPAVARGEDQDRHLATVLAPLLEHAHAIHLGQAEIQNHRIVGFGVAEEVTFLAVARDIDHVAGVDQRLLELTLQVLVVLNKKDAHFQFPPCP